MDFGRVPIEQLQYINFDLPSDSISNNEMLSQGKGNTKFYLGCPKAKDKLNIYSREFNCIELNGTYYKNPTGQQIEQWKMAATDGFKYAVKFPQVITHLKRLKGTGIETEMFLASIAGLGDKLGPLFLMPHPQQNPTDLAVIKEYIGNFPNDISLFLEVRHPDWFTNGFNLELLSCLKKHKKGLVITDAAGRRDAVHMYLSIPEVYIRFVGNSLHETDYVRIDKWVETLKSWVKKGLETCYFIIHQNEPADAEVLLKYLKQKL
jgi:uncharacterized protein YecE (DUF72 family)